MSNSAADGVADHHAPPGGDGVEGGEVSLEELQAQLKAMEEEQGKMAAEYEHVNEGQTLEPHLAVIEEQFRRSFDDRISAPTQRGARPVSFISAGGGDLDLLKVNSVFRDVSRDLGNDWKPVFTDLTASFPPEEVAKELAAIEQMQPIIRGYRALNVWKELAGDRFNLRDLVDVLRKNKLDEIADGAMAIIEGVDMGGKPKTVTRKKSDIASRGKIGEFYERKIMKQGIIEL
jgi:hypothetical protein